MLTSDTDILLKINIAISDGERLGFVNTVGALRGLVPLLVHRQVEPQNHTENANVANLTGPCQSEYAHKTGMHDRQKQIP